MPIYKNVQWQQGFDLTTTARADDTTGTPTVTTSRDGGAFAASTNTAVRIGSTNSFVITLTAAEMNGNLVKVKVRATGDNPLDYNIYTEADYTSAKTGFNLAATQAFNNTGQTNNIPANMTQIAGQTASAAASVTFPATLASTTNISAGTISTVTNLTNAPTAGDFTAAMKASLNAATPVATVSDKTGFSLSVAYDLAKTAAQTGDAMTLTSGERTTLAGVFWDILTSATRTAGSFGAKFKAWVLGTDNKALLSTDAQTGVTIPAVTNVGNVTGTLPNVTVGGYATGQTPDGLVWSAASRTLTAFAFTPNVGNITGTVPAVTLANGQTVAANNLPTTYPLSANDETTLARLYTMTNTTPAFTVAALANAPVGGSSAGSGARTVTVHVTDGTLPLENARVRLSSGISSYIAQTNSAGNAVFALDDATYGMAVTLAGYTYTPTSQVVNATATINAVMTPLVIPVPALPSQSTGYLVTYDGHGNTQAAVVVTFSVVALPFGATGLGVDTSDITATSDSSGNLAVTLIRGVSYEARRQSGSIQFVTVPDLASFALPALLGQP